MDFDYKGVDAGESGLRGCSAPMRPRTNRTAETPETMAHITEFLCPGGEGSVGSITARANTCNRAGSGFRGEPGDTAWDESILGASVPLRQSPTGSSDEAPGRDTRGPMLGLRSEEGVRSPWIQCDFSMIFRLTGMPPSPQTTRSSQPAAPSGEDMQPTETLEREIQTLRERLSQLSQASLRINESLDPETVLQGVLDSARS